MNLPNKLTMFRIFMTLAVVALIGVNWSLLNINWPIYLIGGKVVLRLNYLIAGVLFVVAAVTDMLDGYIARKKNLVTDFGKTLDAIADKVLVNSVLIIFASNGFIHPIIAVIYIFRDEIVNALRIHAAKNGIVVPAGMNGKIKTFAMMVGLSLMFFYNLPFELINIRVDKFLIYFATIMSVVSGIEYYYKIIKIKKID